MKGVQRQKHSCFTYWLKESFIILKPIILRLRSRQSFRITLKAILVVYFAKFLNHNHNYYLNRCAILIKKMMIMVKKNITNIKNTHSSTCKVDNFVGWCGFQKNSPCPQLWKKDQAHQILGKQNDKHMNTLYIDITKLGSSYKVK